MSAPAACTLTAQCLLGCLPVLAACLGLHHVPQALPAKSRSKPMKNGAGGRSLGLKGRSVSHPPPPFALLPVFSRFPASCTGFHYFDVSCAACVLSVQLNDVLEDTVRHIRQLRAREWWREDAEVQDKEVKGVLGDEMPEGAARGDTVVREEESLSPKGLLGDGGASEEWYVSGLMSSRTHLCIEVEVQDVGAAMPVWTISRLGRGAAAFFAHSPLGSVEGQNLADFVHVSDFALLPPLLAKALARRGSTQHREGDVSNHASEARAELRLLLFCR